jgi:predicted transcriptional regulator
LYERGMSQRSIALYLGVARSAVRDRIHRANQKIARTQRGGSPLSP